MHRVRGWEGAPHALQRASGMTSESCRRRCACVLLCRSEGTRVRPTASVLASCFQGETSIRGPVPWSHPPRRHGKRKLMARPPVAWESPVAGSTAPSQQWRCQLQSLLLSVDSSWDGFRIFCGGINLSGVGARCQPSHYSRFQGQLSLQLYLLSHHSQRVQIASKS